MTNLKKNLVSCLKELHLPTFRELYEKAAGDAIQENWTYEQYLLRLGEQECEERRIRKTERLLRQSKLPVDKSVVNLDLKRFPHKIRVRFKTLLDGSFLDRAENVMAFGIPGNGKTHLICALAQELIRKYQRRVLFTNCSQLVQDLLIAKKDLRLNQKLKSLGKYQALIIDDIGYVQQSREEMEVLFTLLAYRYERASVLITSNLVFSEWHRIFKDPMTAAAAVDRLIHHSVILDFREVPSYRVMNAKEKEIIKKKDEEKKI